jgi:hypothetical protein
VGARQDLLATADALAAAALEAVQPRRAASDGIGEVPGDFHEAGMRAHAARAALHAATLVDAEPAPIIAALELLAVRLQSSHVDAALDLGPAEAIEVAGDLVEHYQREVAIGAAVQHGYIALQALLENLHRDFTAADSETARRTAVRIRTGLDTAAEAVEFAKTEGARA